MSLPQKHVILPIYFNEILDSAENKELIIREDVLTPDYVPERLIGRDEQIKEILWYFVSLFRRGFPNNILIFGDPGCGKTVVSKFVLLGVQEKLKAKPIDVNFDWVYIHCKKVFNTSSILFSLIEYLDHDTKIKRSGYSLDYYYNALFRLMNQQNKALVIILDEIDFLKSDNILYNFSRAVGNEELKDGRFIRIIGLSNSRKYEESLDPRVVSSLGFNKLNFPSYNPDEVNQILKDRVELAFLPDSIDDETLFRFSREKAKRGGDIRNALSVLLSAAQIASKLSCKEITEVHLKQAEEIVEKDCIVSSILTLPLHHKLILFGIIKATASKDTVNTGDLTKTYKKICKHLDIKPSPRSVVSKWISSLDMQDYIQSKTTNTGRTGGVTRIISISPNYKQNTSRVLEGDEELEGLKDFTLGFFGNI